MKYYLLFFCSFVSQVGIFAQNSITLNFDCELFNKVIQIDHKYQTDEEELMFSNIKFYISNIQLTDIKNNTVRIDSSFLIDFLHPQSKKLTLEHPLSEISMITFGLGIDSITNVSGIFSGSLDPTNGMYWAWHSGYINSKIEGKVFNQSNAVKTFQWHTGGYSFPNNCYREINVTITNQSPDIILKLDFLMNLLHEQGMTEIMSPGRKSNLIADKIAESFYCR